MVAGAEALDRADPRHHEAASARGERRSDGGATHPPRSPPDPERGRKDHSSRGAEPPNSVTEPDVAESFQKFYEAFAIPANSFARAVAYAIGEPEDVDINEILFRPTKQEV